MYSWEIHTELEKNNYIIPVEIYNKICESPQVLKIKYEPFCDSYELYTTDGYCWRFKIVKEKKGI